VPKTSPVTGTTSNWIGLDGFKNKQVEQMGISESALNPLLASLFVLTDPYYAWYETYPDYEQQITDFPVAPGDLVYARVKCLTSSGPLQFTMYDASSGLYTSFFDFSGYGCQEQSAEWIVERPTVSGSLTALANFQSLKFYDCFAYSEDVKMMLGSGGWLLLGHIGLIDMVNTSGVQLATTSSSAPATYTVTWHAEL
jgi:hypothetical protein